ncbi:type II toxin-antitoxin system Phd/YefM family antitoxin [Microlunatus parietis]|uniref:Antitoxin n=1 Tax=Microlunatus parietis TaxID=682979 RepID=A0A7Y9LF31_9ACTN|nr:type II toxin-antitoxin system prevent-host-death family antitoxin [Microlunatus parietis]NYE75647.1 prevent-host-death family protein [Microlunatus parietis]
MTVIPASELRAHTAAILRRVEAGEEFEVLRDDRPIARIVPLRRRGSWVPATEMVSELTRLGRDTTGLADELHETLAETTDDI